MEKERKKDFNKEMEPEQGFEGWLGVGSKEAEDNSGGGSSVYESRVASRSLGKPPGSWRGQGQGVFYFLFYWTFTSGQAQRLVFNMHYITESSQHPYKISIIITSALQRRLLRLRKAEWLPLSHPVILGWSQGWNPFVSKAHAVDILGRRGWRSR